MFFVFYELKLFPSYLLSHLFAPYEQKTQQLPSFANIILLQALQSKAIFLPDEGIVALCSTPQ